MGSDLACFLSSTSRGSLENLHGGWSRRRRIYLLAALSIQMAWRQWKVRMYEEMGSQSAAKSHMYDRRDSAVR
jgi:hypothetical protein